MIRLLFRMLLAVGLVIPCELWAQEVRFSQYNAAPLLLNPASPGTEPSTSLASNYRIQQIGILAYKTGYFSAMLPVYQRGASYEDLPVGGFGLGILSDLAGAQNELKTYQVDLSGSYNLPLNLPQTHYVTLGVQASYRQTRIDYGVLNWPSQITYRGFENPPPPVGIYDTRVSAFRFNAGLIWTLDPMRNAWKKLARYRLHLGLAVSNLNRPDYSFLQDNSYLLPRVYRLHGGGQFHPNPRWSVSPSFMIIRVGSLAQYAGGGVVGIHLSPAAATPSDFRLLVGSWYRYGDAVVVLLGASGRQFDAALSYDANASPQRRRIPRLHTLELSLKYRFLHDRRPEVHPTPLF